MRSLTRPTVGARRRVIHILDSGAIGGGPRVLLCAARGLAAHDWESSAICGDDGPLADDLRRLGVGVDALPIAGKVRFSLALPRLIHRLRKHRPTAVILYGPIAGSVAGIAARLAGVPGVLYAAHYPAYYADFDAGRRLRNAAIERIACACADVIWCISAVDRDLYLTRKAAPMGKLHLVPNGVSADIARRLQAHEDPAIEPGSGGEPALSEAVAAIRQQHGLPSQNTIVFVGRLVKQKGVDVLLRASALLTQSLSDLRVLVVGEGPEREPLERLSNVLGIASIVTFVGARHDVVPYYLVADVVCVPSSHEPFGLVAVEAMTAGRAVVASRVGGLIDTVLDGACGRLVPPDDPEALANALRWTLQDPGRAALLGARARDRALAHFSEERMAEALHRLLLLSMKARAGG